MYVTFLFWLLLQTTVSPGMPALGPNCYEELLAKGIAAFDNLQFEQAINYFKAAEICTDGPSDKSPIQKWIQRSSDQYIIAIEEARDRERRARIQAEKEQRISQANQLALLSANERDLQNDTNAIILAYAAVTLQVDSLMGSLDPVFSQAAVDYYKKRIEMPRRPIFQLIPGKNDNLVLLDAGQSALFAVDASFFSNSSSVPTLREIGAHHRYLTTFSFETSNEMAVAGYDDGRVDVYNREWEKVSALAAADHKILDASLSGDGLWLLAGSVGKQAVLWNRASGTTQFLTGHKASVLQATFAGENRIITRSADRTIGIWNKAGELLHVVASPDRAYFHRIFLSAERDRFAGLTSAGKVEIWDLEGKLRNVVSAGNEVIKGCCYSDSDEVILTWGKKPVLNEWDWGGNTLREMACQGLSDIDQVVIDSNTGHLLVASRSGTILVIRDRNSGICTLLPGEVPVLDMRVHPTEAYILATYWDGTTRLWDQYGELQFTLDLETDHATVPTVFTPDGRYVISSVTNNGELLFSPLPFFAWELFESEFGRKEAFVEQLNERYEFDLRSMIGK